MQVKSVSLLWENGSDCQTWLDIFLLIKQALAKQSPSYCVLQYSLLKRVAVSSSKPPYPEPFKEHLFLGALVTSFISLGWLANLSSSSYTPKINGKLKVCSQWPTQLCLLSTLAAAHASHDNVISQHRPETANLVQKESYWTLKKGKHF